jgi:hypothetical protein
VDELRVHWPGWDVHIHHRGIPFQLEISGRDPAPYLAPLQHKLDSIASTLMYGDFDPAKFPSAFTQIEGASEVIINQGFFQPHRLPLSKQWRMEYFQKMLAAWRKTKGTDARS